MNDLITLVIAVYLGTGAPIVNTFSVPDETHCTRAVAQDYIDHFILPTVPVGHGLQKRFRVMCLTTPAVEPSTDLLMPPSPDEAPEPEPALAPKRGA